MAEMLGCEVMRIEAVWLALGSSDLRAGMDTLLGLVVKRFGRAQRHHAYVFANRGATRLKVLVFDGCGIWLASRRLQSGRFAWIQDERGELSITQDQWDWLIQGLPWQRRHTAQAIEVV